MTPSDVEAALRVQTANYGGSIAWEDVTYQPDLSTPYIRVRNLPVANKAAGIGTNAPNKLTGMWEIIVCTPTGSGTGDANAIADQIEALFPRGFSLAAGGGYVRSIDPPSRGRVIITDAWAYLPISIPYYAYL